MFSLSEKDLQSSIVACGDGPASFNAELTGMGGDVLSVDPLYQFDTDAIRSRIKDVYIDIMDQLRKYEDRYIWKDLSGVDELGCLRMEAMESFLADYSRGKSEGRYVNAKLPNLPFEDKSFKLALCSHYLFLYSEQVNLEEHILSLLELCRVADEIRVYPLISLDGQVSNHLRPVVSAIMQNLDKHVFLEDVEYQFQRGATQMLVVRGE